MVKSEKDRERDKKERVRERRQRGNRKYGQGSLKHAKRGVLSCGFAAAVGLLFFVLLALAYSAGGNAPVVVGLLGIVCLICAWIGLVLGIRGFRERDKNYFTCKMGVGVNGFWVISFLAVFIRGMV